MNANLRFSEKVAVLAGIDPQSVAASTVVTSWVAIANYHRIAAYLKTGVLGTAATVDAKLRQATASNGAGAKDITGKAITQLVKASNDNNQVILECSSDDLDAANGYSYVALSVTVGAAASLLSADLLGTNPRFAPASAQNAASVVQVV